MSTETHVFFCGKLPSKAALMRAMKELGFPFALKPATGSLERQSGFMPMTLRREETGVEFDAYDDHAAVEEFAAEGVDASFERRASFRWGGDFQEAVAGMCAAAALAKLVNGVVFDEAENRLLSVDGAIAVARQNLETFLKPEDKPSRGTRPADIKRYLKPLLKQRSDLALVGRHLIIRPVRHLLRGVLLDRTGDKYQFQVWRYINPLYGSADSVGYGGSIHGTAWRVWQPHFEPLLLDALAEDIFDHVGEITTLDDFARRFEGDEDRAGARCQALLLAGRRDLAVQLVDEIERTYRDHHYWPRWVEHWRRFLERDIDEVCAEFRSKEARTAKELKLGDIWEPAPFPVEVPEAERMAKCAEPRFTTTPWVPRPSWLVQEAPGRPGEVAFAKGVLWRKGRIVMLIPLTREQAEERYRTRQDYVLVTRLAGETLLVLYHRTGWSPHNPQQPRNPDFVPTRGFWLEAYGSLGRSHTRFDEDFERRGVVRMRSANVYDRTSGQNVWHAFNDFEGGAKSIHDSRGGQAAYARRSLTPSDILLCERDAPAFGEFKDLWQRVERYLANEGFGSFA
jgi:hypothetical protein